MNSKKSEGSNQEQNTIEPTVVYAYSDSDSNSDSDSDSDYTNHPGWEQNLNQLNEEHIIYQDENITTYMYFLPQKEDNDNDFAGPELQETEGPGEKKVENENTAGKKQTEGEKEFKKINFWNKTTAGIDSPKQEAILHEMNTHLQAIEHLLERIEGMVRQMEEPSVKKSSFLKNIINRITGRS